MVGQNLSKTDPEYHSTTLKNVEKQVANAGSHSNWANFSVTQMLWNHPSYCMGCFHSFSVFHLFLKKISYRRRTAEGNIAAIGISPIVGAQ